VERHDQREMALAKVSAMQSTNSPATSQRNFARARLLDEREKGVFPLSFAQARLWILDQLQPGNPAYNIPATLPLRGPVDVEVLRRSLNEVLRRHDALRTTFTAIDGKPAQIIATEQEVAFAQVDLRSRMGFASAENVGNFIYQESRQSFDLEKGPLLRATLARIGANDHLLMLVMHHIVSDGWSMSILNAEISKIYMAFLRNEPSPLPELPIQYADFAEWQAEWFSGELMQKQLAYWKERLTGLRPVLNLPTDRPRPPVQTSQGSVRGFTISQQTCERLKALSQANGATLFMILMAAFKVLLSRLSGETDIAIGTPIANRTQNELEGLIGFFVNTLVLRTDLAGDPTFVELLARERDVALGAYGNQDMPFERLVEELQPDRDLSHNPLFQILFAVQNFGIVDRNAVPIGGSNLQAGSLGNGTAKFDLTLSVLDTGAGAQGFLEYNTDLFNEATAETIVARYLALLRDIVEHPGNPISSLSIWAPDENLCESIGPAATSAPDRPVRTLGGSIAAQAWSNPDSVAAIEHGEVMTYAALDRASNQVARALLAADHLASQTVAVVLSPGFQALVAITGILKAGLTCAPVDPSEAVTADRLAALGQELGAGLMIVDDDVATESTSDKAQLLTISQLLDRAQPLPDEPVESAENLEAAAVITLVAGSKRTRGRSEFSHRSIVNLVGDPVIAFSSTDRIICPPRLDGGRGILALFGVMATGGTVVFVPGDVSPGSRRYAGLLRDVEATVLIGDLADFERLAREFPRALRSVRSMLSDEQRLDWSQLRESFPVDILSRICLISCPSTVGVYSLIQPLEQILGLENSQTTARLTLGRPVGGLTVQVVDADLEPVPQGVPGEIYVDYSSARSLRNECRTGLHVRFEDGSLISHCTWLDAISNDGMIVDPIEIETALKELPGVIEAAATSRIRQGLKDPGPVAIVALDQDTAIEEVRAAIATRLPQRLRPSLILADRAIPYDHRGTLDRRTLDEMARSVDSPLIEDAPYLAPRDEVETALTQIWMHVLGRERVGVHDNFFRMGGHSLIATQIVARISDMFHVEFPLQLIFEAPTIELLAQNLAQKVGTDHQFEVPPLVALPRDRPMPLSFAQQRLWFLDQFEPGSAFYNIALPMHFHHALEPAILRGALDDLVARHETLRTRFVSEGGEPVQIIAPELHVDLPTMDLRGLPDGERQREAQRLTRLEAELPFDLQEGPVIRARLLRLAQSECLLLLTIHHIAADGWSLDILMNELFAFYRGRQAGTPATLPELTIQYADFACWQRRWLSGAVLQRQVDYWKRTLQGAPPLLELPTDRPRPPSQTFSGEIYASAMSGAVLRSAKAVSEQEQVTLFTTLLAAFYVLLFRLTGRRDLVVGSPIASRTRPELEGLIGFFANTIILRAGLSPDMTFRQLITLVRDVTLGAYSHQDIPFEKLVEELQPARNVAYHPLFQVMFALQNTGRPAAAEGLSEDDPPALGAGVAKFDLTMFVSETTSDLRSGIEYNSDLFDADTITRFALRYEAVLAAATADPDRLVYTLPVLLPDEASCLADWNETAVPVAAACTHVRFAQQAKILGDAPAMIFDGDTMSYAQLDRLANAWAHHLVSIGVKRGSRVAISMTRSFEMIVAVLATLKAGACYVPIDPNYPRDRVDFMINDSRAVVMLTQGMLAERFGNGDFKILLIDGPELPADLDAAPVIPVDSADFAYVIYTSGSTGQPKGVAMPHGPLSSLVEWQVERSNLPPGALTAQFASLSFDVSFQEIFATLCAGGTLVLIDEDQRRDPQLLWQTLARWKVERLFLPYVALQQLAECAQRKDELPASLAEIITAGEQLQITPQIARLFTRIDAVLYNQYGPSESHVVTELRLTGNPDEWPTRPSIGRPLPHATIQILDPWAQPCPIGVAGELFIGGRALAHGYLDRPRQTAERFLPDPGEMAAGRLYRTGDRARFLANGEIQFLGRLDDQVKIRGFRVELAEVEMALRTHPAVQEAVVVAREEGGELKLVAHIQADAGNAPTPEQLRIHLAKTLPDYMIPASYNVLRRLPLTPSGKLSRDNLPVSVRAEEDGSEAELTPVEEVLAQIWRDVLQLPKVGVHDSFFDLGGHSLLATRVISRIRDEFGVEVAVRQIFETPTIEALALSIVELAFADQSDDELESLLSELEQLPD